jgi:hypothetical protein
MKVGIFSTHSYWPSHFETDLEIAQLAMDSGDEVYIFNCPGTIQCCENFWNLPLETIVPGNPVRNKTCAACLKKQYTGYRLLEGNFVLKPLIVDEELDKSYSFESSYLESQQALQKLVVDGCYDAGWSMLSSTISKYRNPFIIPKEHREEFERSFEDCCRIYYSTKQYITNLGLEKIVVFNGRFSYTKAIFAAAKATNVDCYIHERGADYKKYSLFRDHTIHSIANLSTYIKSLWNNEPDLQKKTELGKEFFRDMENNIMGSWYSFLDDQDKEMLPETWNDGVKNIVIFTSSEDEFASIDDSWNLPFYKTQVEGIRQIAGFVSQHENIHLHIRLHPNTSKMPAFYEASILSIANNTNVFAIPSKGATSTYKLLKLSDIVITFGSTIGIEAVYWKKPSILVGKSIYMGLKGPLIPTSHQEVEELILKDEIELPADEESLLYGYFAKTYGIPYKYYVPYDFRSGLFKGTDLNNIGTDKNDFYIRIKRRIKNILGGK